MQIECWGKLNLLNNLYLVSFLAAKTLIEDGKSPAFAAGHSVGEFAALATADCVSFLDGLRMVLWKSYTKVSGGGMAAVIGLDRDSIKKVLDESGNDQVTLPISTLLRKSSFLDLLIRSIILWSL